MIKQNNFLIFETYSNINLFEKINLLESSFLDKINLGINWVIENDIDAVLVGGTAVISYLGKGSDRILTPDIDFLVNDIILTKKKLDNDNIKYNKLIGNDGKNIGITVPEFNIDFLETINGDKKLSSIVLKNYNTQSIGGYNIKVINPELLTLLKLDLGRTKDLNDGIALLKSGKLNKELFTKYTKLLKNYLNDYQTLLTYSNLV